MAEKKKTEEPQAAPKNNKKMWMMIAAAAILAVGVGAGAYMLGSGQHRLGPVGEQVAPSGGNAPAMAIGPMVDIEPFIVNILDDEGTRYLKAALTLEAEGATGSQEVSQRMPQVRDAILLVAGNKTFNELRDLQGKLQLRAELLGRVNEILKRGQIRRIYFTEFVVQ